MGHEGMCAPDIDDIWEPILVDRNEKRKKPGKAVDEPDDDEDEAVADPDLPEGSPHKLYGGIRFSTYFDCCLIGARDDNRV